MYNLHKELNEFYNKHVRLSEDDHKKLRDYRENNKKRLERGLDKIGEEDDATYNKPLRYLNQGGYAMRTLNQAPNNDYDIDIAVIFRKEDLPSQPAKARQRIARAMNQDGRLKKPPEARTNAVTVWYNEGQHVDMAIYREYVDENDEVHLEHAGSTWREADPEAVTKWFKDSVKDLSPNNGQVEAGQLRRIVRWLKAFAKSRPSWKLPGGMIMSALAVECYKPNSNRDDVSLYDTMAAIKDRLANNKEVENPVIDGELLTSKLEYQAQVEHLYNRLVEAMDELSVLFKADCTRKKAMKAWHWVFKHEYWQQEENHDSSGEGQTFKSSMTIGSLRGAPAEVKDTGIYG